MDLIKIILAALVMGLVISAVPYDDIGNIYISLLASSLVGCVSYILMMLVLNASHSRAYLRSILPK